jgi:methionyl-tRNA formyltransferase
MKKSVLILIDNDFIYSKFAKIRPIVEELAVLSLGYSFSNKEFMEKYKTTDVFLPYNVSKNIDNLGRSYDVIISWHCRQIFPKELIERVRCINIHPGFNPHNRGYFPHVFSIINKKMCGVTIHEMDEKIDRGPIIFQEMIEIEDCDTSYTVYNKILRYETLLFKKHLKTLINGDYRISCPLNEGNTNYKKDYEKLLKINLDQPGTFGEFIDILRALTHKNYNNAYFHDKNGNRIFVSINLKRENIPQNQLL